MRIKLYRLLLCCLLIINFSVTAATLNLRVIDNATGKQIPARVLVLSEDGQSYFPLKSVLLRIGSETWFMSSGNSSIEAPAGNYSLRVERGKEYERVKRNIDLSERSTKEITLVLKRWINMKSLGYLSSENHIHLSAGNAAAMCAAEDLDFGTSLQWWNRPRFGVPEGDGNTRKLEFAGVTVPVTVYDVEVEEAWGALYLIGLSNPFPFLNDKSMPNLIAAKYGRGHGALNCYQSGWSREVLIDALLGYVDVVNVCNNNFHMHRYQPRSRYSNLLNVKGLPVYPNTPVGMMQMNTDTYYRLLNCGLKLAAGAGSATGAKETPVGYNRAYVRTSPKEGFKGFLEAWKEGKNFVTNGPMLFFSTSEGLKPGDSLDITGSKNISLNIKAVSDSPLGKIEIVKNGEIVKSFSPGENQKTFAGNCELNISGSCWICARATDTDMLLSDKELEKYRSPRVKLFQDPNRLRYAHTSPIYFYVNGKGIAVKKSVDEGLKMIDAFREFALQNAGKNYRRTILNEADKAENILRKKLE